MKAKNFLTFFLTIILILISTYSFADEANTEVASTDPNNLELYSQAAIIIEPDSGKILYEKNSNEKLYPASTTKIMTAILAIENCDLDDVVTVNYNAISSIPSGYSTAELVTDENITVKQLLEVLLVHSANDAANVLAMHVGGSIDSFVSMMNSKAQELGCTNTNFTNAYGLQDENHYTTAHDLALIARYCMQNSTFRHFVSQTSCQIPPTNKHITRTFNNTNDLINPSSKYYYKYAIGIKTGYTKEAGNCLISASNKDGFETIAVVLNSGSASSIHGGRYTDSTALYNYAYNNFEIKKIANKDSVAKQITVFNGTKDTRNLDLVLSKDIKTLVRLSDDNTNIEPTITLNDNISAPIAKGTVLGKITYNVLGTDYSVDLVASHDVEKSQTLINTIRIILIVFVISSQIILILAVSRISRNKSRRKKIQKH